MVNYIIVDNNWEIVSCCFSSSSSPVVDGTILVQLFPISLLQKMGMMDSQSLSKQKKNQIHDVNHGRPMMMMTCKLKCFVTKLRRKQL
jgi:hypothetical protein